MLLEALSGEIDQSILHTGDLQRPGSICLGLQSRRRMTGGVTVLRLLELLCS